jgi:hypothetical protein
VNVVGLEGVYGGFSREEADEVSRHERGELQRLFSNVSFRFCTRCLIQMQEREGEWKKDWTIVACWTK